MLKDDLLGPRVPHALNHRGMVHVVREHDTARKFGSQGGKGSIVCNVARRENQRTALAMEIGELLFKG